MGFIAVRSFTRCYMSVPGLPMAHEIIFFVCDQRIALRMARASFVDGQSRSLCHDIARHSVDINLGAFSLVDYFDKQSRLNIVGLNRQGLLLRSG
jgi:hypothetical protein